MSNTSITDVGLKELAKLQQLERLYLHNAQITEAEALAKKNPKLLKK